MARLNKRKAVGTRGRGRPTDITPQFKDAVATRAMQLRMESYTLQQTVDIVNDEFDDSLAFETVRRWIEERIKPQLAETSEAYRQHLLDQISVAKRSVWKRVQQGDDKAVISWTRLLDREMDLTGVKKPQQIALTTNAADGDAVEVVRMLDQFFGRGDFAPDGPRVIQGEVVSWGESGE